MKDKNKVINLFGNNTIVPNEGVKYSELLEKFLNAFKNDFLDIEFIEDIFEFAIMAWNFGNMSVIIPNKEFEKVIASAPKQEVDIPLLKRMIAHKVANYKEYNHFIVDFEFNETNGDPILKVLTESEESHLAHSLDYPEDLHSQGDFEENYINRTAIVIKPLQPFIDWHNYLYPDNKFDEVDEVGDANIYLVNDEMDDLEAWLKKKFDKFFMMELYDWHTNKKEWPQKRNYKMFKQWFQVEISTMIYDLEKSPVFKSE